MMPADTTDQQITYPVDGDSADNPAAFLAMLGDVEPRLVREYTTEADRTTRMTALTSGDVSVLTAPSVGTARTEVYDGANHISLYRRSMFGYIRKAADETVNNNATLQGDNELFLAVPTAGTFQFELNVLYSASTVADIKFAFTWPAGVTAFWSAMGLATGAGSLTGDCTFSFTNLGGTSVAFGGIAVGTPVPIRMFGEIIMGGTAGTLQLQWAQQNLEATNATVHSSSNFRLWRIA